MYTGNGDGANRKKGLITIIAVSHLLSSWGDRIWGFAVGLYLVILYPDSLQVAAIYGFTTCASVIVAGPFLGKWIDKTSRFRAAAISIAVQNGAVTVCAVLLILSIGYPEWTASTMGDVLVLSSIIIFAAIAELGSVANKIAIQKDWIVVLADGNHSELSKMNAIMRTIDLTTSIIAPAAVAQIIAFVSKIAGAAFIAGWNVVSATVEIYLLYKIFRMFPQLAQKSTGKGLGIVNGTEDDEISLPVASLPLTITTLTTKEEVDVGIYTISDHLPETHDPVSPSTHYQSSKLELTSDVKETLYQKITESLKGWRDYFKSPVRFAGLGLACLYMTVLGFDSITLGYMYFQGVNESFVGIISAAGAISGILGSVSFPFIRSRLGKFTVGNIGFGFETLCLVACVTSIFVPGSPFLLEDSLMGPTPSPETEVALLNWNRGIFNSTLQLIEGGDSTTDESKIDDYTSVLLFIFGIVASRFGLWIADLSVTQIFQEEIPEEKRGVLNGVQDSLNQAMNLIKFVLVIVLPSPATFGYLIGLSWIFMFLGWVCFIIFTCTWKQRSDPGNTTPTNS